MEEKKERRERVYWCIENKKVVQCINYGKKNDIIQESLEGKKMFKKLGEVEKIKFKNWCVDKNNLMVKEKWFGKEVKEDRRMVWFGVGIELGKNEKFKGLEIDNSLKKRCLEFYGENFNSLLLIKYGDGSKLNLHKDRDCFDKKVVIVNSGICVFEYDGERKILEDGKIYEIDGKKSHGVVKVVGERYSLSIRKVL